MTPQEFVGAYSMPVGPGFAYPPPPYRYRGVEDLFIAYESDAAGVERLLPPGVLPADDPPVCIVWGRWVPFSTFGPYHEAYVMIRALFEGQTYLYQPFIFTDGEMPLEAGREIWGYAKKLAVMRHNWSGMQPGGRPAGPAHPYGEQLLFTVERPAGQRIMTASLAPDALADPADLDALPVMSCRVIPNAEPESPPSVAQLVRLDVAGTYHNAADGSPMLFSGRAGLTIDSLSQVDPWYLLAPVRLLNGWFARYDFDLPHGKVVRDYLIEDWWG